jgi:hypothetical protein
VETSESIYHAEINVRRFGANKQIILHREILNAQGVHQKFRATSYNVVCEGDSGGRLGVNSPAAAGVDGHVVDQAVGNRAVGVQEVQAGV